MSPPAEPENITALASGEGVISPLSNRSLASLTLAKEAPRGDEDGNIVIVETQPDNRGIKNSADLEDKTEDRGGVRLEMSRIEAREAGIVTADEGEGFSYVGHQLDTVLEESSGNTSVSTRAEISVTKPTDGKR